MMLETWVLKLLSDIKEASLNNENFDLHLDLSVVKKIAKEFDDTTWIEIY